jgi:hypothetical protein
VRRPAILIAIALLCGASTAAAQTSRPSARAPRFTISGGLLLNGSYDLGDRNAELRGNSPGSAATFTLFHVDGAMERAIGIEARLGFALSRLVSIEVGGTRAMPHVNVTVGQDAESSGTTLVEERVSQYSVDVGGVVKLPWRGRTGQLQPYVLGGGGYLRQLHEDRLLVETGHTIFGGGGVQYALRAPGRGRPFGVRAEAKFVRRVGGIDFDEKSRIYPGISALGYVVF